MTAIITRNNYHRAINGIVLIWITRKIECNERIASHVQ